MKTFQASAKGLEVDGRYGPKTSGKLRIARAKAK